MHSFACTTNSFTSFALLFLHCSLCLLRSLCLFALLCSFVRSLTHSLPSLWESDSMLGQPVVLNHSVSIIVYFTSHFHSFSSFILLKTPSSLFSSIPLADHLFPASFTAALWSRTAKNPDIGKRPLAHPFVHSLVPP